jgi:hypothetical protein
VFGATGRLAGFGGAGLDGALVEGAVDGFAVGAGGDVGIPTVGRKTGDEGDAEGRGNAADGETDAGTDGCDIDPESDGPDCRPKCAASAAPPRTPATPSPMNPLTNQDRLTPTSTAAAGCRTVSAQSKVSCVVRRGMSSSTSTPMTATRASATKTLCVASYRLVRT